VAGKHTAGDAKAMLCCAGENDLVGEWDREFPYRDGMSAARRIVLFTTPCECRPIGKQGRNRERSCDQQGPDDGCGHFSASPAIA